MHADLNADGVLDHVQVEGWVGAHGAAGSVAPRCTAVVTSGQPARGSLWNATVCRALGDQVVRVRSHGWDGTLPPGGPILLAPPTVLPVRADARRLDAAFLNSRGDVTLVGAEGRRHFQLRTEAGWNVEGGAVPTLMGVQLRAGPGAAPVLLAAGERAAVLLSPSGTQLATFALPSRPAAPLQGADLRGDGVAGLLLSTGEGLYAFRQRSRPGLLPLTFLAGSLCLLLLGLLAASSQLSVESGGRAAGRGTDAGGDRGQSSSVRSGEGSARRVAAYE